MKKLFLLALLASATLALADSANIFSIDFESAEGYTTGDIIGQKGWEKVAWFVNGTFNIANDASQATSGQQYVAWDSETGNDGNELVNFDLSSSYVPGTKLIVSGDMRAVAGQEFYVKVQNVGTTGATYDKEIFECRLYGTKFYFTGSGETQKYTPITITDWHHFAVTLNPSEMAIEKLVLDGAEYEYEGMTYKTVEEGVSSIPDSLRLMKKGDFDNFRIDMVPEPAFLGLLALAGLLFARKN